MQKSLISKKIPDPQSMISFDEAYLKVIDSATDFGDEKIRLQDSNGRILAEDILADRDYPPFNRATMDGFALRLTDWENGIRKFFIQSVIWPGEEQLESLGPTSCFKIMTGASVPEDLDLVIRKEDSLPSLSNQMPSVPNHLILNSQDLKSQIKEVPQIHQVSFADIQVTKGQNIAQRGKDLQKGEFIPLNGQLIDVPISSLLASLGYYELLVKKLPVVSVFTTGNEIRAEGELVSDFQIRNSNQYLLKGLLKKWNIGPNHTRHLPDSKDPIRIAIKESLGNDILIFNGAVSAGDADFIPELLIEAGMEVIIQKVAMRPGKPFLFGKFPQGPYVFALPGNPFSCMTTFIVFVQAFLKASFKMISVPHDFVCLSESRRKEHPLTEFFPVKLNPSIGLAEKLSFNGSGDIRASLSATGLAVQEAKSFFLDKLEKTRYFPF